MKHPVQSFVVCLGLLFVLLVGLGACSQPQQAQTQRDSERAEMSVNDVALSNSSTNANGEAAVREAASEKAEDASRSGEPNEGSPESSSANEASQEGDGVAREPDASAASSEPDDDEESNPAVGSANTALDLSEDYRDSFDHGPKGAAYQKYIVLHDTEGEGSASGVIDYWDGSGAGVAAHFVVNKDGSVVQCVPLDRITHHAGYGDAGHNDLYGITEDGRDDMVGTVPIGDWAPDYGMNAWSVGIEMVHVGGSGDYPEEQLEALDALIAYIDGYYGFESAIIDHKAWRSGNSDTSPEFADCLANYQDHRTHV